LVQVLDYPSEGIRTRVEVPRNPQHCVLNWIGQGPQGQITVRGEKFRGTKNSGPQIQTGCRACDESPLETERSKIGTTTLWGLLVVSLGAPVSELDGSGRSEKTKGGFMIPKRGIWAAFQQKICPDKCSRCYPEKVNQGARGARLKVKGR